MPRKIKLSAIIPPIREWRFFDNFFLTPAIATFSLNTYKYGKDYMYTRYITLYWLWFDISLTWEYGKAYKTYL